MNKQAMNRAAADLLYGDNADIRIFESVGDHHNGAVGIFTSSEEKFCWWNPCDNRNDLAELVRAVENIALMRGFLEIYLFPEPVALGEDVRTLLTCDPALIVKACLQAAGVWEEEWEK